MTNNYEGGPVSRYMLEVGRLPFLSQEEETGCSETILLCKWTIIRLIVGSTEGKRAIIKLYKDIEKGEEHISYTLRKEDFKDEEEQKRDKGRTLKLFDSFIQANKKVYKSRKIKVATLAEILERINLNIETLKKIAKPIKRSEHVLEELKKNQQRMIEGNLRLVMTVVKSFVGLGISFEDLVQEGNLGLIRATEDYDYRCGNKFSTYAYYWIRQKISRCLMNKGRTIRLPISAGSLLGTMSETIRKLSLRLNRKPTKIEIANSMNITVEKLDALTLLSYSPVPLESSMYSNGSSEQFDGKETKIVDSIQDNDPMTMDRTIEISEMRGILNEIISSILTPREEAIIRLHFGIYPDRDTDEKSYGQMGRELGITKQGAHQGCEKALKKLRGAIVRRGHVKAKKEEKN